MHLITHPPETVFPDPHTRPPEPGSLCDETGVSHRTSHVHFRQRLASGTPSFRSQCQLRDGASEEERSLVLEADVCVVCSFNPVAGLPLVAQWVKNLPVMQETQVRSLGQEDPLEKGMATHSRILAWRVPGTEEPGGL